MNKANTIGWIIELAGTALWLFGYFTTGNSSLIDWQANSPWWIAQGLHNIQSDVGMALVIAGMMLIYWPRSRRGAERQNKYIRVSALAQRSWAALSSPAVLPHRGVYARLSTPSRSHFLRDFARI